MNPLSTLYTILVSFNSRLSFEQASKTVKAEKLGEQTIHILEPVTHRTDYDVLPVQTVEEPFVRTATPLVIESLKSRMPAEQITPVSSNNETAPSTETLSTDNSFRRLSTIELSRTRTTTTTSGGDNVTYTQKGDRYGKYSENRMETNYPMYSFMEWNDNDAHQVRPPGHFLGELDETYKAGTTAYNYIKNYVTQQYNIMLGKYGTGTHISRLGVAITVE